MVSGADRVNFPKARKSATVSQVRRQWLRLRLYGREKNPKHEARNSKQFSMTEIQMFQTVQVPEAEAMILSLTFGHLIFEFVSDFEIRNSNFLMAAK
jgi:hypothetical protein